MSVQILSIGRVVRVSLFAMLFGLSFSTAAAPTLDTSFGVNGLVDQRFPDQFFGGIVLSSLIQRDGRILASGRYNYGTGGFGRPLYHDVLARYNEDGSLDANFGQTGVLSSSPPAFLQRDGKIVGVGPAGLTRFNSDGSPDTGFITNGAASIPWSAYNTPVNLAQQADGKIIVFGWVPLSSGFVLARFDTDGSLDSTFNNSGYVLVPHEWDYAVGAALVIGLDGKLVIATSTNYLTPRTFTVAQYNPDGTLDSKFGSGGTASATFNSVVGTGTVMLVRQPNGRLIVAGVEYVSLTVNSGYSLLLVGFTPTGQADATFGTGGTKIITGGGGGDLNDFKVQPDGKVLVAYGYLPPQPPDTAPYVVPVMRFTADGAADTAFGNVGTLTSSEMPGIRAIALQANGDLVLGGISAVGDFALTRFISGPSPAIEFYNASLDHYFMSMNPQEVADLDLGVHVGWARTGQSFQVFGSAASAAGTSANPVCRFYIPPEHGDSHFFSADPAECAAVLGKIATDPNYSGYINETPSAFYAPLPDLQTGICPAATIPVYRLWNQRVDSNHRYTTDSAIKSQMLAKGYVAEGYGPDAVAMCAPQ